MAENDRNTEDLLRRLQAEPPKKSNQTRNALLLFGGVVLFILLALVVVKQKEFQFNPTKTSASSNLTQKIVFTGELKMRDLDLTPTQQKRLEQLLDYTGDRFKQIQIWAEKDNKYDELKPGTEVRFQITLVTHDGARIKSVVNRAKHGRVVDAIAQRIEKDVEAYLRTEPGKNPPGSFTNVR